uniref:uncharacterized protein LOC108950205 n=1 Tax=Ciona intestinalis TaxID=7719 RepID=UPI00089DB815|nr:uncharacterized protein LOC108950205 [Ciona intestinalis]|eukprot:XP_018670806.1 uncharacterized protein LOC108950205 [Ciona intestinalis]
MEAILEKMASFEEMFLQLKNKQDKYESDNANSKNNDAASPAVAVITGSPELKEMRKMLNSLETSLKDLTALVKRTDDRLDDLEQYGRRNCLIIHGNRMVRNDVYAQKRNLKGTGMAMTESLTSRRLQIVEKAKASFGFRNVWTANGTIYVTHNNKRKWG